MRVGWIRPLAVFSVAGGLSLATFQLMGGAHGGSAPSFNAPLGFSFGGYDLASLELLEPTLFHIEESYVEPARVDWEKMYVAGLQAVERRVPACKFQREPGGDKLNLEIGEYRSTLQVAQIGSRKQLQNELKIVATLLKEHLTPDDIPTDNPNADGYAEIEYAMVNGVLGTLDPHSVLLPPKDSKEMDVENEGSFGGLGITIVDRDGKLTIEYPLPDTPAQRAGLQPDDRIVRIDGESTINMSLEDAVSRLRGPVGKPVNIEIERANEAEPIPVDIVRAVIKINPVQSAMLDGGIGYVTIKSFHQEVARDLHAELKRMHRESGGLRGLVLDLRGNPGGYLTQAVEVSDTFLWEGTIVSTLDGAGRKRDQEDAHSAGTEPRYPIAVLVNAASASASEIVSGALRNNERAVIIGERTFGKGSVQNLHPYFDESKLKLTISKYLTPGDRSIQSVGIPADIELLPSMVETRGEAEDKEPYALLYWRERVRREADLDKHLEQSSRRVEEPVYSVRYVRDSDRPRKRNADLDLDDFEIQFARDVLTAATSYNRADVLAAAGTVVNRHRRQGADKLLEAFAELEIDWTYGAGVTDPQLDVRVDLGEDGKLTAGVEESIALEVTNRGEVPIFQLAAIAGDHELLSGREFLFGRLEPGETRRYSQKVKPVAGYPTEQVPVTFNFRDAGSKALLSKEVEVEVQGRDIPLASWSWKVDDSLGDGDGIADLGERLRIDLTVENLGKGATAEAFARIKNRSRRALDIKVGTLELGKPLAADGTDCVVEKPGTEYGKVYGDPGHARVAEGRAPVFASGCSKIIDPGTSWTGSFEVELKEAREDGYALELTLGDATAYDHASIVRAGFYDYFTQKEEIRFQLDQPLPSVDVRTPPQIEITRAPAARGEGSRITVSGVVTDDTSIKHVMVFAGDDKVFYQGSSEQTSVRSVPFTADITLQAGDNTITVLATDDQGFTATKSAVTFYAAPEVQAKLGSDAPDVPE